MAQVVAQVIVALCVVFVYLGVGQDTACFYLAFLLSHHLERGSSNHYERLLRRRDEVGGAAVGDRSWRENLPVKHMGHPGALKVIQKACLG